MAWLSDVSKPLAKCTLAGSKYSLLQHARLFYTRLSNTVAGTITTLPPNTQRRRLGHSEEILDIFSMKKSGSDNICLAISLTSKQILVHEHVRDALVLLAKRQPMLRAVITIVDGG